MPLKKYHEKRDFSKTKEPKGKVGSKTNKRLQFVIQKHAASHLHYDFRLEMEGVLKSWAVPKGPCLDPAVKRLAVHVEDHPIQYGTFEGIIPKGEYGGGSVLLWDKGTWELVKEDKKSYKQGNFTFKLNGKKLKGLWKLVQIKKDPKNWLLIKVKDEFAFSEKEINITEEFPYSVKSKKLIEDIDTSKVWFHGGEKRITKKKSVRKKNHPKKRTYSKKKGTIKKKLAKKKASR